MIEQWIQKGIGAVFIIISSSAMGFGVSRRNRKRLDDLHTVYKLMIMLRGEIQYGMAPFEEAFLSISERMEGCFRLFLVSLVKSLSERNSEIFPNIWKEAVNVCLRETYLSEQDLFKLEKVGNNLGYLDKTMQINTIQLYIDELQLDIEKATRELPEKCKIYNCFGVLGGILIVILIL